MTDQTFSTALLGVENIFLNFALIIIVASLLFWGFMRFLRHELIEKGSRDKIIDKINESKFIKKVLWIINPDIEFPIKKDADFENEINKEMPVVSYNSNSKQARITYKDSEMIFDGTIRPLLLLFFSTNKDGKKNYLDYNTWLINNGHKKHITDYRTFRQEIAGINGRLEKDSPYISEIIKCIENDRSSSMKANFYQFKVKLKIIN